MQTAAHGLHASFTAQQAGPESLQLELRILVKVAGRVTTASAIVLYPILDQIGVLATVGQHGSVKLLEAELPSVMLVEAPVEQVNVIVGKIHEAKSLL